MKVYRIMYTLKDGESLKPLLVEATGETDAADMAISQLMALNNITDEYQVAIHNVTLFNVAAL